MGGWSRLPSMHTGGRARFAWLLQQRGIPYCDKERLEEWISVQETRPDVFARPLGFPPFLAEVAAPLEQESSGPARVGAVASGATAKALSRLVRHAAAPLRSYRRLGVAMIVVLDHEEVEEAELEARDLLPLAVALEDRRPYVSAVLATLPKGASAPVVPGVQGRPMRVRVLHNPSAIVPLHLGIFAEPEDEHMVRVGDRWVDIRTGALLLSRDGPPPSPPPE